MIRHHPKIAKQTGVTLLENMVALIVLSVGLLGLAGLQAYTLRGGSNTQFRLYAMQQAEDMAGRIRANLSDVYAATSAYNGVVPVVTPSTAIDCRSAYCNAAALANFDVYQWEVANNALFPGSHSNLIGGYISRTAIKDNTDTDMLLWYKSASDLVTPPTRMRYVITLVWDGDQTGATGKPTASSETCPDRTSSDLNCYKLVVDL